MFLAAADTIRDVLGFDDMPDINAAVTNSLNSATTQLESLFTTSFARAVHEDIFFVPRAADERAVWTQFRLSNGFLAEDPIIEVGAALDVLTPITLGKVHLERGLVTDLATRFVDQYVKITYTAGFELQETEPAVPGDPAPPPVSYDLTQVPEWLQEAAKLKAFHLIGSNPALTEANVLLSAKTLAEQLAMLVNGRLRYHPSALLPL